jgi:hypothetical protein
VGSVCSQRADDWPAIGRQLACSAGILSAYCHHTMLCLQRAKREHNGGYIKGFMVLCVLKEEWSGPCYSFVGGPDPRDATCQFIPFDPFLAVACCRKCCRTRLLRCVGWLLLVNCGIYVSQVASAERGTLAERWNVHVHTNPTMQMLKSLIRNKPHT